MKIDDKLLQKLEKLSSLQIEDEKKAQTIEQLSEILNFVENLSELDLDSQDASFNILKGGTILRKDEPKQDKQSIQDILKHAPKTQDRFFNVPAIIE